MSTDHSGRCTLSWVSIFPNDSTFVSTWHKISQHIMWRVEGCKEPENTNPMLQSVESFQSAVKPTYRKNWDTVSVTFLVVLNNLTRFDLRKKDFVLVHSWIGWGRQRGRNKRPAGYIVSKRRERIGSGSQTMKPQELPQCPISSSKALPPKCSTTFSKNITAGSNVQTWGPRAEISHSNHRRHPNFRSYNISWGQVQRNPDV